MASVSGQYIGIKTIIENVYRNFKFNYDLDWNDTLEWCSSLMALLSCPLVLQDDKACINITDARGQLPCDLHSIVQTARMVGPEGELEDPDTSDPDNITLIPMRWATNTFHGKWHCAKTDFECTGDYTYTVNNNFIFTNFDTGKVAMAIKKIPTDDKGFPLIPYEESWRKAFEWEIAYRIAYILFLQDSLRGDKLQLIERDRDWYVAQAVNSVKMPDLARLESDKNDWTRMIPSKNAYQSFFANMQTPEKKFNYHSAK